MKRKEALEFVIKHKLVPVVRAPSADLAIAAAEALAEGGVRIFEITMTVPGATSAIETLRTRYSSQGGDSTLLIGAGTVLNDRDARKCIDAGSQFIVSPGLDHPTIDVCNVNDVAFMPGTMTPTEVMMAWKEDVDMVKIFPCSALGGAKYLKALKAPFPDVKMMPTGGVSLDTMSDFLSAGAEALGVGANLVDVKSLQEKGPSALIAKARQYVEALKSAE